ncbi:MAG: DUF2800 domain-containing protein [Desulfitobacteriaceae bacterium]
MKHALLGASKAGQWINCPPSARLQESVTENRSEYAEEGTVAHELAEIKLRRRVLLCNSKQRKILDAKYEKIKTNKFYGQEMEQAVHEYVELVEIRVMAAKARSSDAVILLEERLDYSDWVPEGFGTGDVVLIADGVLEVIDLKYGKGVPVSAYNNPQPRLYGLGAWAGYNYLYSIDEVYLTIIQPRLDSVSTDIMPLKELLEWAESVVKPAAVLAFAGEGDFCSGDHCRWCKVKGNCRARADENMKALAHEFKEPALLSNEEIGSILFITEQLKAWAKDVEDYASVQALKGNPIPQWKLVEGRSNRSISDKDAAIKALKATELGTDKFLKPEELLGIGELEKRLGKKEFGTLLGAWVVKPPGKPTLVPESDGRSELNSIEGDFSNIDMED